MVYRPLTPVEMLDELEPSVARGLDRHLGSTNEWFPHQFVPYEDGRNYLEEDWSDADSRLPDVAQTALEVNLLTEDNLPYYHLSIWDAFGRHESWAEWVRRWTAEEGRHAIVLRDFLTVTRGVDPQALERSRMDMVARGWYPDFAVLGPLDGVVFTTIQELATRVSHRNTGLVTDDERAVKLTHRIATDENLHYVFYRDMAAAALAIDPSATLVALERQVRHFQMPGSDMPGFAHKARIMAKAGIYNLRIHLEQVLVPILHTHWRIADLDGLTDEGELARDAIVAHLDRLAHVVASRDEPAAPVVHERGQLAR